ncbi:hypothetical protein A3K73_01365 [Candidatus Pacearchaeota archaeon RBG_13_36_9]|nr:MAG: hypothetical protein A3K73_01365 [Candidatus Pacearchaeota archaeon RBG_13_36_9]
MKITLYLVPEDNEGKLIKEFLQKNKIPFKEILTNDLALLQKIACAPIQERISLLEIKKSHSIHVITGFIKHDLTQLVEHIEKYKPNIKNLK